MVENQSLLDESAETNFDSIVSASRVEEIEDRVLIRELFREVVRLRKDLV